MQHPVLHLSSRSTFVLALAAMVAVACDSRYTSDPALDDAGVVTDAAGGSADAGAESDGTVAADAGGGDDGAVADATKPAADGGACGQACHVMFVTSATFSSNLGGQAGADQKCQAAAASSKIQAIAARSNRFVAWISTGAFDSLGMGARLPAVPATFARVDGQLIAGSVAELRSGNIRINIVEDENGSAIATGNLAGATWTGTRSNSRTSQNTCADWTSISGNGDIGQSSEVSTNWTEAGAVPCNQTKHLYCLEQ